MDLVQNIAKMLSVNAKQNKLFTAVMRGSLRDRFDAIRGIYALHDVTDYDPYIVDWTLCMTPIESDVWYCIRCLGLPFYPQYPACGFFLDFADPVKKIAFECDGRQWHSKEKDLARDNRLNANGWLVHRFEGWECRLDEDNQLSAYQQIKKITQGLYE